MADVILVQPHVGTIAEAKRGESLPLSLLSAARLLARHAQVKLIDVRLERDWRERLCAELGENPTLVGITSICGEQLTSAIEIASFVKARAEVPVVLGGSHATILPRVALAADYFDFCVIGEGEGTLDHLYTSMRDGGKLSSVRGIGFKDGGGIVVTPPASPVDLSAMPELPISLCEHDYGYHYLGKRMLDVEWSRGCSFRCGFCYHATLKAKWRAGPSPALFVERLRELKSRLPYIGHFYLVDDNYFVDKEKALEIAERMLSYGIGVTYHPQGVHVANFSRLDDKELKLLERSGLNSLEIGVESGSPRILKEIARANAMPERILECNRRLKPFQIHPRYNFIVGFPGETPEDISMTVELIDKLVDQNPRARISPLSLFLPVAGAPLFEKACEYGLRPPQTNEEWARLFNNQIETPWVTPAVARTARGLSFLSHFIDGKMNDWGVRSHVLWLSKRYGLIARFKWRHQLWHRSLEQRLFEAVYANRRIRGLLQA